VNIELHIERLILDGLAIETSQGAQVQAAVEGELMRLLAADGLSSRLLSGGTMPRLPTTSIQVSDQPNPIDLGQQIAGAVYGGIGR
jgi:hypothetical protein